MTFEGFPVAALDFYDDLEMDNTKSFWEANKHVYQDAVREPMLALTAALADEFGEAKIYRPYRDVRFSKDRTPYKTHQGAFVAAGPAVGWYVQIGAPGVMSGFGFYEASGDRLAAIRAAIDDDDTGEALVDLVATAEAAGLEVGGDTLKTTPRGYPADHPRIGLLRHRQLVMHRSYGFEPVVHTAELADLVRADWRAGRPLVDWIVANSVSRDA